MEKNKIKLGITVSCFLFVILLGIIAVILPDQTKSVINRMFNFTVFNLGSVFLWYALFGTIIVLILAFSKFGNIYLGGNKPQFSKLQLFAMALSVGMGASTMYWAFIESVYYYMDPQFGIVDNAMKMEYATAFNMFHWGPVGWILYLMCGIPFMISFYLKKNRNMSLSGVINSFFDNKLPTIIQKIIDILFIITSLAATSLTLGLSIPMISSVVSEITGIASSITLGIGILIGLSLIFSLSSYIGIEKGVSRLSSITVYICAGMVLLILIIGPTALLINNTTNGMGIAIAEYVRMSTNMAPFGETGFPQYWTIFFFANWLSYAPGMGVFITKIAKGHKLKDVILILTIAGFIGTSLIFGICGTYTMHLMDVGLVDAREFIASGNPTGLVTAVFNQTPFPIVMLIIYLVTMILFTVTTLDGTSFSLASVSSEKVNEDGNVSPLFKLFWCLLLTVIPIIFLLIRADLNILKSFPVLIVVPMMPIFAIVLFKSYRFLSTKCKKMTVKEIEDLSLEEDS